MLKGRRVRLLSFMLAATLLAAGNVTAGCGDDNGSKADKSPPFAVANEPPQPFIERVAKLLETTTKEKDCVQLKRTVDRSTAFFGCPAAKKLRESMANFRVVGVESHDTGAIVDYQSGQADEGRTIVMFVAPDRRWGISRFGVGTEPSSGTSDSDSRAGYDRAVDKYLKAVLDRDCDALFAVSFTAGTKEAACKSSLLTTGDLAKRLKANPSAKPRYQGGNATYGFYSLETDKPAPREKLTISVLHVEDDGSDVYIVLDAVPGPTASTQRRARQQQRNQRAPGDMSPSSKPSDPATP